MHLLDADADRFHGLALVVDCGAPWGAREPARTLRDGGVLVHEAAQPPHRILNLRRLCCVHCTESIEMYTF